MHDIYIERESYDIYIYRVAFFPIHLKCRFNIDPRDQYPHLIDRRPAAQPMAVAVAMVRHSIGGYT